MQAAPVSELVQALAAGRMVVLVDDEDRENEGDLVVAAQFAGPETIAFMATRGCGLICLAMDGGLCDRLHLGPMTTDNRSRMGTAFTVSIEAREGVTTGISAADRARTIAAAISPAARPTDVVSPGHVFPLRARDGGVLVRAGQTEGSVDLARLAGLTPAAVICEIMLPDGTMARRPDLERFCAEHGLLLGTVADLIAWRERQEALVEPVGEADLHTEFGPFRTVVFRNRINGEHHLALLRGERLGLGREVSDPVLVRVHKEVLLDDAFGGRSPVGRLGLRDCQRAIATAGEGVLLYLRDADGADLLGQLSGLGGRVLVPPKNPPMDPRDYGIGAQILRALGVRRMRLLSGSDRHIAALAGHGLEITERLLPAPPPQA
jgi:3,4-dihydroxy 2-butanone 4-phosphate synthase/GTP cyclohydrolase II